MFKTTFCALIAASTVAAVAPYAAASLSVSTIAGDAAFNTLTNNGTLEVAVTEGRIGNSPNASGTWEQAIWQQGGVGQPVAQVNHVWTNSAAYAFTIQYDGISTLSYATNGQTLTYSTLAGPFTDIFIRTRSGIDSSMSVTNLSLTGHGALPSVISTGNGDVDYLRISGGTTNFGAFTLTGSHTFTYGATAPSNSALAYQIKFTNVIPSPAAACLLALAGLSASRRRRA